MERALHRALNTLAPQNHHGLEGTQPPAGVGSPQALGKGGTGAVSQTLSIGVPSRGIQGLARSWPKSVGHVLTSPLLRGGPSQSRGGPLVSRCQAVSVKHQ